MAQAAGGAGGAGDLPPQVAKRVEELEKLQEERNTLRNTYLEERKALELKYHQLYAGVERKRAAIVAGDLEVAGAEGGDVKGIPKFWLRAFQNNRMMRDFVEEHDEDALSYLRDVAISYGDDMAGFTLTFKFAPNPYFNNAELTKTINMPNVFSGEDEIGAIKGCDIDWKAGKNLTVKMVTKKVKKGKGRGKNVTKEEEVPSFFRFFETPDVAALEEEDDEEDEDAAEAKMELYQQIQFELAVAQTLRQKIVPQAVKWFTGEAEDSDEEDEDDDDEDEDDDEEGDEEEEDDDEDDEEEEKPKGKKGKGKGKKKGSDDEDEEQDDQVRDALAKAFEKGAGVGGGAPGAPGAQGEKPPECKNQ